MQEMEPAMADGVGKCAVLAPELHFLFLLSGSVAFSVPSNNLHHHLHKTLFCDPFAVGVNYTVDFIHDSSARAVADSV